MTRMIGFVREERVAALDQLSKERVIALTELRDAMTEQRQQITSDVDQITVSRIDYTLQRVNRLVMLAMAAAAVMALLCLLLARWILVRPGVLPQSAAARARKDRK